MSPFLNQPAAIESRYGPGVTRFPEVPIYLPNKDLSADALIERIGEARPDAMAGHLIAANTRILSF